MNGHPVLFLEDEEAQARRPLEEAVRRGKAEEAGAHDHEVGVVRQGRAIEAQPCCRPMRPVLVRTGVGPRSGPVGRVADGLKLTASKGLNLRNSVNSFPYV
jgi:hypothetical protein